jgi:uncharacterized protein (DUF2236 family)
MPVPDPTPLYPPDSVIRRLSRERAVLVAGPAAAILQVAHPRVALGVAEHSDFTRDAIGRLTRTMRTVNAIVFGTRAEAEAIRTRMLAMHERIRGSAAQAGVPGSASYHALEPDLLLWVLATLCFSGINGWEWLTGQPLPEAQRREYLAQIRVFGEFFGLPAAYGPQTWEDFAAYYQATLEGPDLANHPICAEQARLVLIPARPRWAGFLGHSLAGLSSSFIPEPVRTRLRLADYAWSPPAVERAARVARAVLPLLPPQLRYMPEYLRTLRD